ncbi:hypothetical protein Tco_0214491 [Tanacetum coccineum]
MVDVPIHQEDLAVQRTPLIDPVISMVTEKTASTPTPPITQAHDYIKMEMQIPRSSRVKFIATCSYSRLNDFITSRKNDPKLSQTLISTSSSVCQRYKVMTDYESWSQRIRLYCRGKENGLLILQSNDQGPFELGTTRNTLGTTPEGSVLLGPERPRTYEDLSDMEKK